MSYKISQLAVATQIFLSDLMIINNLGVTKSVTVQQLALTIQGAGFQLDNTGANNVVPVAKALASGLSGSTSFTNIDVAIQPKGTGGFALQVADNTNIGGNKRGTQAVDLQMSRTLAAQAATANLSCILGGRNNTNSGGFGVIGGGDTNTASGSYPFVGGGTLNVAAGNGPMIGGGQQNNANGTAPVISGGQQNSVASGSSQCTIAGGLLNTIGGNSVQSSIGGGNNNSITSASGFTTPSTIPGGSYTTDRGTAGFYGTANGRFTVTGDAQCGRYISRRQTVDATPSILFTDGNTSIGGNAAILPDNSCYQFTIQLTARTSAGVCAAYELKGLIKRGTGAATTALVGSVTNTTIAADAGAASWAVAASANASGYLQVQVTGAAATTIRWVADIRTVEVVF